MPRYSENPRNNVLSLRVSDEEMKTLERLTPFKSRSDILRAALSEYLEKLADISSGPLTSA